MKFVPLVLKHLRATWIRSASTLAAIAAGVALFCALETLLGALDDMVASRSPRRLVTQSATSFLHRMPLAHGERIRSVDGVSGVAPVIIFGGMLPAPRESGTSATTIEWSRYFPTLAVDADAYLAIHPELIVAQAERATFQRDLQGCLIGRELAEKHGWKPGDRFFLESFAPPYRKPGGPFEFVVRGLIDADRVRHPGTDTNVMLFHLRYLTEGVGRTLGAQFYVVEITEPERAAEIARAIDVRFENSEAPTRTATESAFLGGIVSLAGNLSLLLHGIGLAVTFSIVLVTANTISMAVRERRTEIGVLKTIGFSSRAVMGLVMGEALALGVIGGVLGVSSTVGLLRAIDLMPGSTWLPLQSLKLSPVVALLGLGAALVVSLAAALVPAWGAYRARITDTLRTV